jgi:GNAT superfamily N-acetyltransferase
MFTIDDIIVRPLIAETWSDFEKLFGSKGAYGGCWCMWWRLPRSEFEKGQGAGNRMAMKKLVKSGIVPGLIAYKDDFPCGWCSVAPREQFGVLERSRVLKRIDNQAVWSIVCFFIDKNFRHQNIGEKLIIAAISYVKSNGGKIIEAYPTQARDKKLPPVSSFTGITHIYQRLGFQEMQRPSPSKVYMRFYID